MNISQLAKVLITAFLVVFVVACEKQQKVSTGLDQLGIKNFSTADKNVFSSGQPSKKQLAELAKAGVKNIVNLRPLTEQQWDEAAYVASLGMQYHSIPVAGVAGVSLANAAKLKRLLQSLESESTLVHCGSANRVGALIAVDSAITEKQTIEEAIQLGKNWGLSSLETAVRQLVATQKAAESD